ncbi:hypothetical protein BGZ80_006382 [Entomortierella chlamydospora]|uniref:F-box domain protein n=1 Tax=Entomortierella chlamydospora TaxID=101097 RepID=A0A9P6T2G6_9FUNG|nr:hypothetical protein BGZ80_006382 [Entomortierella chlamydospora]
MPRGALDHSLSSCNNLNSLCLQSPGTVDVTYDAFRLYFHSLTSLDTKSCGAFSSRVVQDIMTSCPSLKTLRAYMLMAMDVLGEEEIADLRSGSPSDRRPRDWVCLGLETFSVCITEFMNDSYYRLIFQRLAKLTRLEVLDVGTGDKGCMKYDVSCLKFRIDHGMGALVSLRRLRWLGLTGLRQQMDVADIQWMLRSWPHLERVSGVSNTNRLQVDGLEAELQKRGFIKRDTD